MLLPFSFRGLASRLLSKPATALTSSLPPSSSSRCLSTTTRLSAAKGGSTKNKVPLAKKPAKTPKKKRNAAEARDPKIVNMLKYMSALSPKRLPPPLRMARNRWLRHWTIHRAWMLFRRQETAAREKTLMRQYQGISNACEALRLTEGPAGRGEGYLYRVAMEKHGVYGLKGIPIEYARAQTETPARVAWNHDWKR